MTILDDINNELVARWVRVTLSAPGAGDAGIRRHRVVVEDRQPNWDNRELLLRLKPD